jgi:hypothetical protein
LEFEYELNSYYFEQGRVDYEEFVPLATLSSVPDRTVTSTFTVPAQATRQKIGWFNSFDGSVIHNDHCYISLTGPGYNRGFVGGTAHQDLEISLVPGATYTITIETFGSAHSASFGIDNLERGTRTIAENRTVGGLRIKKTTNCPGVGQPCLETFYDYVLDEAFAANQYKSSGVTFFEPEYISSEEAIIEVPSSIGNPSCEFISCSVYTQSSTSLTPMFNSQGNHIVYRQVNVYRDGDRQAGKKTHKFLVDVSNNNSTASSPFPPLVTYDWLNGLPLEEIDYKYKNGTYVPVNQTNYFYN